MPILKIKRRIALLLIRAIQRIRIVWYSILSTTHYRGDPPVLTLSMVPHVLPCATRAKESRLAI
jgi:hypothetical protein